MSHVHRQGSGLSKSHIMKREHAKHRAKITGDTEGLTGHKRKAENWESTRGENNQ